MIASDDKPHLPPQLTRLRNLIEQNPDITFQELASGMGYEDRHKHTTSTALTRLNDYLITHDLGRIFSSRTKEYEGMDRNTIYRILE